MGCGRRYPAQASPRPTSVRQRSREIVRRRRSSPVSVKICTALAEIVMRNAEKIDIRDRNHGAAEYLVQSGH